MEYEFKVDRIVKYLHRYKEKLPELYQWKSKSEKLVDLKVLYSEELIEKNSINPYQKVILLKSKLQATLNTSLN